LRRIGSYLELRHVMFSDPELLVAGALALPTEQDADRRVHRRVVIVVVGGRIERTFGSLVGSDVAGSAHQVLTWLRATR